MDRKLKVGEVVIFIDPYRKEHKALVTAVWGDYLGRENAHGFAQYCSGEDDEDGLAKAVEKHNEEYPNSQVVLGEPGSDWPCINLLYVTEDDTRHDSYGRQIDRETSLVHISHNSAGAMCYKFPDE